MKHAYLTPFSKGLVVLFVLFVSTFVAHAQWTEGEGTEANPYLIANASQLAAINTSNNGTNTSPKYFKLTADIDLTQYIGDEDPEGWAPLGGGSSLYIVIDGDNHVISGLWINRPTVNKVALIGQLSTGSVVKNLGIVMNDAKGGIQGQDYVSALVAYSNNSLKIENIFVRGNVSGRDNVAGIIAYARSGSGNIKNLYYAGNVAGRKNVGGLINHTTTSGACFLNNSVAVGTVTGTENVGGIAGAGGTSSTSGTNYLLTLTNVYALNTVSGTSNVGALVGNIPDTNRLTVINSFANDNASAWPVVGNFPEHAASAKKSSSDLLKQASYESFDFTSLWESTEDVTYPYLKKIKSFGGASDVYAPTAASYTYNGTTTPITLANATPIAVTGDVFSITFDATAASKGSVNYNRELGLYSPAPYEYIHVITGLSESGIAAPYLLFVKRTGAAAEFTFTFQFNNGVTDSIITLNPSNNYTATRPADPVYDDHTFINWFADGNFTSVFSFSHPYYTPTTAYAQWKKNLNVTYVFQDGVTPDSVSAVILYGNKAIAPAEPVNGNTTVFLGWYTTANYTEGTLWNFDTPLTDDLTLYAAWLDKPTLSSLKISPAVAHSTDDAWYYVKFQGIAGVWDAVNANPAVLGNIETVFLSPVDKSRTHVQLWKIVAAPNLNSYYIVNQAGNILRYVPVGINAPVSGTLRTLHITADDSGGYHLHFTDQAANLFILYGFYNEYPYILGSSGPPSFITITSSVLFLPSDTFVKSYTVSIHVDNVVTTQTVFEGSKAVLPANPAKDGHTFDGWFTADNTAFNVNGVIVSDTTIYAHFSEIVVPPAQYTVAFNADNGTTLPPVTVEGGALVAAPAAPEKTGYNFLGWALNWDFNANKVYENITLTAQWEAIGVGINAPQSETLKTHVSQQGLLTVTGLNSGERYKVYNVQGIQIIETADKQVQLPTYGVYIVVAGERTAKVIY